MLWFGWNCGSIVVMSSSVMCTYTYLLGSKSGLYSIFGSIFPQRAKFSCFLIVYFSSHFFNRIINTIVYRNYTYFYSFWIGTVYVYLPTYKL